MNCLHLCMQIGAEIFKRALTYPIKQIARNSGVNGNVVIEKVFLINATSSLKRKEKWDELTIKMKFESDKNPS